MRFVKSGCAFSNCFLPIALRADNHLPLQSRPHLNPHTVAAEMWLQRDVGIPQALGLQGVISRVRNAIPGLSPAIGQQTPLCPSQAASASAQGNGDTLEWPVPTGAFSPRPCHAAAHPCPGPPPAGSHLELLPSPLPPKRQVCAWRSLITACRGRSGQCSGCTRIQVI